MHRARAWYVWGQGDGQAALKFFYFDPLDPENVVEVEAKPEQQEDLQRRWGEGVGSGERGNAQGVPAGEGVARRGWSRGAVGRVWWRAGGVLGTRAGQVRCQTLMNWAQPSGGMAAESVAPACVRGAGGWEVRTAGDCASGWGGMGGGDMPLCLGLEEEAMSLKS